MRKLILLYVFVFFSSALGAQEQLSTLPVNTELYFKHGSAYKKALDAYHEHSNATASRFYFNDNFIYRSDTLSLPFTDDFFPAHTLSYSFESALDSNVFAAGMCLQYLNITTENLEVIDTPTFVFSFDTLTNLIVKTPNAPILIYCSNDTNANCLQSGTYQTWYPAYDSVSKWDSLTGNPLIWHHIYDSVLPSRSLMFYSAQNGELWTDNFAWVNNTNPIDPICIGVATLDGLNQYGLPYADPPSMGSFGQADYLTSRPLNLQSVVGSDSLYLSFFYEGGGRGDWPDVEDSLLLQFRDNTGHWNTVWSSSGYATAADVPNTFDQVMVKVPEQVFVADPFYFYNGFQFRFTNYASTAGNNDHWHIDYVRFDINRDKHDTLIQDICQVESWPGMLKEYTRMPMNQFGGSSDLADDIAVVIRNNGNTTPSTDWNVTCNVLAPSSSVVFTSPVLSFPANPIEVQHITPSADFVIPAVSPDTLVIIETKFNIAPTAANLSTENDTVIQLQQFDFRLAYDDGTAEKAYGVEGSDGDMKKFAYRYVLNTPDTLKGIEVHYAHIDDDVSNLLFNLVVWKRIDLLSAFDPDDSVIYRRENMKPYYIDTINGFVQYRLDTAVLIDDTFFIGYEQFSDKNLQLGYDKNSPLGLKHMFVQSNDHWNPTAITEQGSVMMRALMNGFNAGTTAINVATAQQTNLQIVPNPLTVFMRVNISQLPAQYAVYNMNGQCMQQGQLENDLIKVGQLPSGVYLLHISSDVLSANARFVKL